MYGEHRIHLFQNTQGPSIAVNSLIKILTNRVSYLVNCRYLYHFVVNTAGNGKL